MYNMRDTEIRKDPILTKAEEMKMLKRLTAVLLALVLVLCAAAALAETAGDDPVLVTVNGEEIRKSNEMLQFWTDYIGNWYLDNYGIDPSLYSDYIQQSAMDYTIHYIILRQKLEEQGGDFSTEAKQAMLKAEWNEIVEEVMEEQFNVGAEASEDDKAAARADAVNFIEAQTGYTEEIYLNQQGQDTRATIIMINDLIEEKLAGTYEVTDEDVEAYYKERAASDEEMIGDSVETYELYSMYFGEDPYFIPEGFRGITHILLAVDGELLNNYNDLQARLEEQADTEQEGTDTTADAAPAEDAEPVTQEMVDAAKQAILDSVQGTVDEINAKLAAGASFEDLIPDYGIDPGVLNLLTTGYAVHAESTMWEPNFHAAAMALEAPGDISEPIVSAYGVHILHYLRDIPRGPVELTEQLKADIRKSLESDKYDSAVDNLTSGWVNDAVIEWTEAGQPWKPEEDAE